MARVYPTTAQADQRRRALAAPRRYERRTNDSTRRRTFTGSLSAPDPAVQRTIPAPRHAAPERGGLRRELQVGQLGVVAQGFGGERTGTRLVPRAPASCRVRRTPLRCEGRVEPGPKGHSALGTSSTLGETRHGLRVSPTRCACSACLAWLVCAAWPALRAGPNGPMSLARGPLR